MNGGPEMSRNVLVLVLLSVPSLLWSQDQAASARAAAGCGPQETQFDVKTDKKQHPMAQPEPGKALVYVLEDEIQNVPTIGAVTTRVGMDGKWVGANHGASYFFFSVDPGEHRLCTAIQSSLKRFSKLGSALTFTADAGKIYYFRVAVEERQYHPPAADMESIDPAQGQFLIASHALSSPRPREVASQ